MVEVWGQDRFGIALVADLCALAGENRARDAVRYSLLGSSFRKCSHERNKPHSLGRGVEEFASVWQ